MCNMKSNFVRKPGAVLKQYIIVIVANFTLMHMGLCTAWMSPVLVKLRDVNQTVLPQSISESEGAWMVSIGSLVAITAMLFTGLLANHLGRKATLVISCLPRIAMSFLFVFASRLWMLYLGRCLCSISDFMAISVTTTYSSEIASKEVRGALGTLSQVLSAVGAMIMLSIGPFVSYVTLNIFLACIIIATFIPILFLPESPCFLHSKGRTEEALKVLQFIRNTNAEANEELKEYTIIADESKINVKDILCDKVVLITFAKVIVLSVFVQLIGYNAVSIYLQTILIHTNTSVRPEISSVIVGFVELLACFCTILLTDRFGRKPILSISLVGTAVGMKEVRGALGTLSQVLSAVGAMIMLSIGPFVSYVTLNIFLACIIIATFIPILFLPESPCFLHSKGRTEEALKVLQFIRNTNAEANEELKEYTIIADESKINVKDILCDKVVLITFAKVIVLSVFVQLIGYNAVSIYLQTILIHTNTSVRPEISSVIVGFVELLACFCTILLTDRFGRKPILSISLVGTAVGMIGLGTFFTKKDEEIVGLMNYLPLASIVLVVYCYNSGLGSLLWMLLAELFDGKFRAFGVSIGVFFSTIFVFLTLRFFPAVTNSFGPVATYWMFALFSAILCVFILFCIPETKGRSFVDIQKALGRRDLKESKKVVNESVVRTVAE